MSRLTYSIQREANETGGSDSTLTLQVRDLCLHLNWQAHLPGDRYKFEGISVTCVNLAILTETDLMRKIAALPFDIAPPACRSQVERWGFKETKL